MIAADLPPESTLPKVAETMRLQNRRVEIMGAIEQIGKGYPIVMQAGGVYCRLSDHGRETITSAVHADLIWHLGEIEKELRDRGVALDTGAGQ